jgi:peptidoglycan/xylan/chitin deacetylase (PgdA/CDA1 family)
VNHGPRTQPIVALTIDDGFSVEAVAADLAILQERHVNATWLPIGAQVAAHPDLWRQVADAGYPFANHTWSHRNLSLLSIPDATEELERANREVGEIIGRPLLPLVRPPGGNWDADVLCAAAAADQVAVVTWDTSFGDSGSGTVSQLIANAVRGQNGSIILMHANGPLSQQALPAVIDDYRARGFEFVTLGQLLGLDGPVPFP